MANIKVNINGTEYTEKYSGICVGYGQTILNTTVIVDGSEILNHFKVTCDSKWIKIQRLRNLVTIVIAKNCSLESRLGVIEFVHNMDSNIFIRLSVEQIAAEYNISVDQDLVQFDTLLDKTDDDSERCEIKVTAYNGMCDFCVGPIAKYAKNIGEDNYYSVTYDNGIDVVKKINENNEKVVEIFNYGKVSLYDYTYYIVTLYHINNPRSTVQIRVDYADALENNQTGFDFSDDFQND